ncbi:MAG: DMT family transporter [Hoeflea sp.]|uniref:DMT family transporter n=1 Tax=Hoeflea sp. TaxID=1940281 RepID=UPI001DB93A07|nr:DMT family transporter [Hoeflea sp.]MBU4529286.1 DMT family transporter [Alphaproteobacteria bacterium]MBU4545453.1 DMT family transporter [Alphaproteobacteria bacterium]MBU4550168.1 DMT family transporter [Alphaproteobacteria bacterium]MBV1723209.1 DMT family transporter [Hoeflea sp.]MBV1782882.1 DMT family transporter [Hoeflea sp.]
MTIDAALRLLAVMVLWAACFPLITIGLDLAPHIAFAAMRAALAGICLIALGILCGRTIPAGCRSWGLIVVVGLGATSMGFLGMFHAAEFVSPGLATVIANVQPIIAAVLAHLLLGERLKATGKIGLAVGLAGIAVIALPSLAADHNQGYSLGIAYVVIAATGVSVGNVAIKRLTGQVDPIMAMGFQLLIGAVPLALLSMVTEDVSLLTWSTEFVLVLVALSVFGSSLAFWLWFEALERVSLNRANAFTFLVPIFGLMIGAAFFGERLKVAQVAGVVLVLAGIVLVQRDAASSRRG